jgi:hypothetical protein
LPDTSDYTADLLICDSEARASDMTEEFGIVAEEGHKYETQGFMLFREVDYQRTITGNGESILIIEQKGDSQCRIWENGSDPLKEETATVPAGCWVRVIAAPHTTATATFRRE